MICKASNLKTSETVREGRKIRKQWEIRLKSRNFLNFLEDEAAAVVKKNYNHRSAFLL